MEIKQLHSFAITPKEAIELQKTLVSSLVLTPYRGPYKLIAGADASYSKKGEAIAAVVVLNYPELEIVEVQTAHGKTPFPYVPGLLSFREIPLLLEAFSKLKNVPDCVICDGQGIAHPRGIGLAAHLGLFLGIPTAGCAKTRLCGEHLPVGEARFSESPLYFNEKVVGTVLRTKEKAQPLYISPGNLIDVQGSVDLVRACLKRHRLPEPTRLADKTTHP